jgi:hypothetical protein
MQSYLRVTTFMRHIALELITDHAGNALIELTYKL